MDSHPNVHQKQMEEFFIEKLKQNLESYSAIDQCVAAGQSYLVYEIRPEPTSKTSGLSEDTSSKKNLKLRVADFLNQHYTVRHGYLSDLVNYKIKIKPSADFITSDVQFDEYKKKYNIFKQNKIILINEKEYDRVIKAINVMFEGKNIDNLNQNSLMMLVSAIEMAQNELFTHFNKIIEKEYKHPSGAINDEGTLLITQMNQIPTKVIDNLCKKNPTFISNLCSIIEEKTNSEKNESAYSYIPALIELADQNTPEMAKKKVLEVIKSYPNDIVMHLCRIILDKPEELSGNEKGIVVQERPEITVEKALRDIFWMEHSTGSKIANFVTEQTGIDISIFKPRPGAGQLEKVQILYDQLKEKQKTKQNDLNQVFDTAPTYISPPRRPSKS